MLDATLGFWVLVHDVGILTSCTKGWRATRATLWCGFQRRFAPLKPANLERCKM